MILVYDISILSNIPQPIFHLLSPSSPPHRLRPLFSIGVHDIPFLVEDSKSRRNSDDPTDGDHEAGTGWIACTTDSILAMKDTLWDVLVTLPAPHSTKAARRIWPKIEGPGGIPIRASQRDLRRFRTLEAGLARLSSQLSPGTSPTTSRDPTVTNIPFFDDAEEKEVVEPLSWTALAYNGFMWWASAGEQALTEMAEESARDAELLADMGGFTILLFRSPNGGSPALRVNRLTTTCRPQRGAHRTRTYCVFPPAYDAGPRYAGGPCRER